MRLIGWLVLVAVLVVMGAWLAGLNAGDSTRPRKGERVDLPVSKPIRPTNWEDADKPEDDEADDDDDDEEPPIEFFDEEIEGDKVVYVLDRTGSMGSYHGSPWTDPNGNVHSRPRKWEVLKWEVTKSITNLPENAKFTLEVFSTSDRVGGWYGRLWKRILRKATPANKQAAISWLGSFHPTGCTPIYEAVHVGLTVPNIEVMILHSDGMTNSGRNSSCSSCENACVSEAKAKNVKIYTFLHRCNYSAAVNMMRNIANRTGGTFTRIQ